MSQQKDQSATGGCCLSMLKYDITTRRAYASAQGKQLPYPKTALKTNSSYCTRERSKYAVPCILDSIMCMGHWGGPIFSVPYPESCIVILLQDL